MHRRQDAPLVALAVVHGLLILAVPSAALIAAGIWWNSNTIAHNFIHRPFFRRRPANVAFALFQSALLGIPQALWRQRHLAHHAGVAWHWRWSPQLAVELGLIVSLWSVLAVQMPVFFAATYAPAYIAGLVLCALQGRYEHAGLATVSHHGRVYNRLCFNDGYHGEHHAFPGLHWSELPARAPVREARVSRWPPLLRWMELFSLNTLEVVVLRSPRLQRLVVDAHARAIARVLQGVDPIRSVAIVGGGLFPRTAIVLQGLLPGARLVILDEDQRHLDSARAFLDTRPAGARPDVEFRHETFVAGTRLPDADLAVVPLAFRGDRRRLWADPPAPLLLMHDWCWRGAGRGRLVSLLLLKRVYLIHR